MDEFRENLLKKICSTFSADLRLCYLTIDGMTCDSCVFTITTKLRQKPGIESINVDLATKITSIVYNANITAIDFLIDHIHDLNEGFTARLADPKVAVFHIFGLNCGRCVNKIQSSLDNVVVNLAQGKAFSFQTASPEEFVKSIQNLGFKAFPLGPYQGRVLLQVKLLKH